MSFLDPQSWTDVDFAGVPLDWSSRSDKLTYPAYEMLRRALSERLNVAAATDIRTVPPARGPNKLLEDNWCSSFQTRMDEIIITNARFVNLENNGGDWDGFPFDATFAPLWTEATLLTAIGDPVRLLAPQIPRADWCLQQYKLLNKLVWLKKNFSYSYTHELRKEGLGDTWAAAVTAFLAAAWQHGLPGEGTTLGIGKARVVGYPPSYKVYKAEREKHKYEVRYDEWGDENPPYGYVCNIDWYFTVGMEYGGGVFDDEGMGMAEDRYWKFASDKAYAASVTPLLSPFPTDREDAPPEPAAPPPTNAKGWHGRDWYLGAGSGVIDVPSIVKFDVVDGFKFQV